MYETFTQEKDEISRILANIKKYLELNLSCDKEQKPLANTLLFQLNRTLSFEISKTYTLFEQVLPSHIRKPRGLFNFIGTFQKSITGTLDAEDGERYEQNFKKLFNNEAKLKIDMERHLSITNDLIKSTNKTITTLVENQKKINLAVADIGRTIETTAHCIELLIVQNTLDQLSHSLSLICNLLEELSTAISFANLRQMHQTIIKPDDFIKELLEIQSYLKKLNLPFQPTLENIIKYEKLCRTSVFQKNSYTYFIIKIPLIETTSYDYYKLYPLPVEKNESYFTIIPRRNYLLMKPNWYSYTDTPCTEVELKKYLCIHNSIIKRTSNEPCEIQLIDYSKEESNCIFTKININNPKIQRVESSNSWIITSPSTIIAETYCEIKKKKQLKGNYIITMSDQCYCIIDKYKLNPNKNFQGTIEPIDVPLIKINSNLSIIRDHTNIPTMDHVDLEEFSELSRRTQDLQEDIKNQILEPTLIESIPWTTYALIIIIIMAGITIIWKVCTKYQIRGFPIFNIFKNNSQTRESPQEREMTNIGPF